tara:strand:+ start:231 stop:497 length:267 start_codon:yes stop_codon:yes gene_type:complete
MNYSQQYSKWQDDMRKALRAVYTEGESEFIVKWWDSIKGSQEYEWFGSDFVGQFNDAFFNQKDSFDRNKYRNWTARLWLYAPNILKDF